MTLMEDEIKESSEAIRRTGKSVHDNSPKAAELVKAASFVILTGSGTSFNAGHSMLLNLVRAGIPALEIRAPDFSSYINGKFKKKTVVIVLSQSGESRDAITAAELAIKSGASLIGVTNERESALAKMSSVCLLTDAGRERSVAATKSFTAQLAALLLLKGDVENINYQGKIEEISKWAKTYTEDFSILDPAVKKLKEKIVILGDGYLYSIAMEAALKLRETANLTTDAFNLREYLHGPIRTLDRNTTVIILGRRNDENTEVVEAVSKYAGSVVEIGDTSNADVKIIPVEECLKPLVYALPIQIMACRKTLSLGLNPDKPDKLTKVVR